MASNRFYTILIVPEKTSEVRKFIIPAWLFRGTAFVLAIAAMLAVVMLSNYWHVISQIDQNLTLRVENRKLKQQVQIFENRIGTIESTLDRIRTFSTRLKVITNIEARGQLTRLQQPLPDATANTGSNASVASGQPQTLQDSSNAGTLVVSGANEDPEELQLRREYKALDSRLTELGQSSLAVEEVLQDQYELLADQKAFLAALPTRKPAVGYFTSGFGVRRSPYGGRVKMHEGLDIANRPGTVIHAPADGLVSFADTKSGYGQTLILDHGYGLETWYAHARRILVKRGQKVNRGDQIAQLGNSGRSTGPHLHYEVRVHGTPVDPLSYILEN